MITYFLESGCILILLKKGPDELQNLKLSRCQGHGNAGITNRITDALASSYLYVSHIFGTSQGGDVSKKVRPDMPWKSQSNVEDIRLPSGETQREVSVFPFTAEVHTFIHVESNEGGEIKRFNDREGPV